MNKNSKTNKAKEAKIEREIAVNAVMEQPQSAIELINKYGTYEIQPTADTFNDYPMIAQGLPRKEKDKQKKKEL